MPRLFVVAFFVSASLAAAAMACGGSDPASSEMSPKEGDEAGALADAAQADSGDRSDAGSDGASIPSCDYSTITLPGVRNTVKAAFPSTSEVVVTNYDAVSVDGGLDQTFQILVTRDCGKSFARFPANPLVLPPGITAPAGSAMFPNAVAWSDTQLLVFATVHAPNGDGYSYHILSSDRSGSTWHVAGGPALEGCGVIRAIPRNGGWLVAATCGLTTKPQTPRWTILETNAELTTATVLDQPWEGGPQDLLVATDGCIYAAGQRVIRTPDEIQQVARIRRSCAGGPWEDDFAYGDFDHGGASASPRWASKLMESGGKIYSLALTHAASPDAGTSAPVPTFLTRTGANAWTASPNITSQKSPYPHFLGQVGACDFIVGNSGGGGATLEYARSRNCGASWAPFDTKTGEYLVGSALFGKKLAIATHANELTIRVVTLP